MSGEEVGQTIRTDRRKYSIYDPNADDPWEHPRPDEYVDRYLYDLRADPHEQRSLIDRNDHREVADRLWGRLADRIESE